MDFDETLDDPYTTIKGFECKRSDTPELLAKTQKKVFRQILDGVDDSEISDTVFQAAQHIDRRHPDWNKIGIPGGIGKDLDDYDTETAQVRAAKNANKILGLSLGQGDKPKRVYLDEKTIENNGESVRTDVIGFSDVTDLAPITDQLYVDVAKMREKVLRDPMERVLNPVGINVDAALHGQREGKLTDYV
jgi:DNA polymerase I